MIIGRYQLTTGPHPVRSSRSFSKSVRRCLGIWLTSRLVLITKQGIIVQTAYNLRPSTDVSGRKMEQAHTRRSRVEDWQKLSRCSCIMTLWYNDLYNVVLTNNNKTITLTSLLTAEVNNYMVHLSYIHDKRQVWLGFTKITLHELGYLFTEFISYATWVLPTVHSDKK